MLPPKSETNLVTVIDGLAFQWLFGGRACLFVVQANSREIIDSFINILNELLQQWDVQQPFYTILDASNSSIAMSPYLSAKIKEPTAIARNAQLKGMYYTLRPQGFVGEIVERLGSLFVRYADTLRITWVKSIDEGIKLIEAQLANQQSA